LEGRISKQQAIQARNQEKAKPQPCGIVTTPSNGVERITKLSLVWRRKTSKIEEARRWMDKIKEDEGWDRNHTVWKQGEFLGRF
jgi:hypothetical protein